MKISTRSLYQKRHYRRRIKELRAALGDRCIECGSRSNLTIDHVKGREYEARKLSSTSRVARYWKEFEEGVKLRLLCNSCNSSTRNHPEECRCASCIVSCAAAMIEHEIDENLRV